MANSEDATAIGVGAGVGTWTWDKRDDIAKSLNNYFFGISITVIVNGGVVIVASLRLTLAGTVSFVHSLGGKPHPSLA